MSNQRWTRWMPAAEPTWLPRAVCLLGETVRTAPGLAAALRERDYQVNEFDDLDGLLEFLRVARPGALLLDARALSQLLAASAPASTKATGPNCARSRPCWCFHARAILASACWRCALALPGCSACHLIHCA
ncbi:MAG: hypothetical protein IPQ17_05645 [Xanthomonadales bacterium]|nr:hypothetical protein [Xanthomonadales bacterium]